MKIRSLNAILCAAFLAGATGSSLAASTEPMTDVPGLAAKLAHMKAKAKTAADRADARVGTADELNKCGIL